MTYVKDSLFANEQIEQDVTSHGISYVFTALLAVVASMGVWQCLSIAAFSEKLVSPQMYIVAVFFIVWSSYSFWNLYLTEMLITNFRVVRKTGLIYQSIKEIGIFNIDSVEVRQSLLGRMFNYGTVCFKGVGVSKKVMFGADMHFANNRLITLKFKRVKYPQSIKLQTEILMAMINR